eukprot:1144829-Pelagomonas_calceolata.AAC.4
MTWADLQNVLTCAQHMWFLKRLLSHGARSKKHTVRFSLRSYKVTRGALLQTWIPCIVIKIT